jgi:hypothetical protein
MGPGTLARLNTVISIRGKTEEEEKLAALPTIQLCVCGQNAHACDDQSTFHDLPPFGSITSELNARLKAAASAAPVKQVGSPTKTPPESMSISIAAMAL